LFKILNSVLTLKSNLLNKSTYLLISAFIFLNGCAVTPTHPNAVASKKTSFAIHEAHLLKVAEIKAFNLKGKIGVQANRQSFSGSMHWQHALETDNIALYSPLGSQVADIKKTPVLVTLTDNQGQAITEKNAEALTEKVLGWQLPLAGLSDWVLGRPKQSTLSDREWDDDGKLIKLTQEGWQIEYTEYTKIDAYLLPTKMHLQHGNVKIKLVIQQQSLN
jgi:outer membrane lipoprotein LolB